MSKRFEAVFVAIPGKMFALFATPAKSNDGVAVSKVPLMMTKPGKSKTFCASSECLQRDEVSRRLLEIEEYRTRI